MPALGHDQSRLKTTTDMTEETTPPNTTSQPQSLASAACSPPLVIVVPLDTPAECIADLRAAGLIAIRTDTPDAVRIVTPGAQIVGGDLMMAAMHAADGTVRRWTIRQGDRANNLQVKAKGKALSAGGIAFSAAFANGYR